mgnify:CR=1 FL=1
MFILVKSLAIKNTMTKSNLYKEEGFVWLIVPEVKEPDVMVTHGSKQWLEQKLWAHI